jgi:luciferase family oxidoreductase group 1
MIPYSILDLSPITRGSDAAQSFRNTLDLARHAERWGYQRFWLAEHHGMPGIASAATAVLIGHVAGGTSTIRVGAGGIMLPNHSPLVIAEQFGTLESLYPGRIDLGLGRAPGADMVTARALRRNLASDAEEFPRDVLELADYFSASPRQSVRAVPGTGLNVPLWILGSSLFGAQVAAALGLPFAFASHFAPAQMMEAITLYRVEFRPSQQLAKPHVGRPSQLPPPVHSYIDRIGPQERAILEQVLSCASIGTRETVQSDLRSFIRRTGANELMITSQIFDHAARLRSFEIAAQALAAEA